MKLLMIIILGWTTALQAQNRVDEVLSQYIKDFNLKPLSLIKNDRPKLYRLGQKLFNDTLLSGNKNISCSTCHDERFATTDNLPVNIGEGSVFHYDGTRKVTASHQIGPRNTPALFNTADPELRFLFWDGRVEYNKDWDEYTTPEESLNGDYPENFEIVDALSGTLSAQVLFPMVTEQEMLGRKGSNEIANADSMPEQWALILKRLWSEKEYQVLIREAYPRAKINIGHIASALAYFIKIKFAANQTPWDRYLRGDLNAMSHPEKMGAFLFMTRGQCITCHTGSHLGGNDFMGVASPQLGPGKDIHKNDEGRFYVTAKDADRYTFRVPPLRNVALTAPYFHSGAYQTLEEVMDHYTNGAAAIDQYNDTWINGLKDVFGQRLFVETNHYMLFKKKNHAHELMKNKEIILNDHQKHMILMFLKNSLTQK